MSKKFDNREFFRTHQTLYYRVLDNRCPICNSTIMGFDRTHENFGDSGLCKSCGKEYGNNLSRALYKYEKKLWREKCENAAIRQRAKMTIDGRVLPFIIPGVRIYPPKLEPSYVIENRSISLPPTPKRTPRSLTEIEYRKYRSEKEAGII